MSIFTEDYSDAGIHEVFIRAHEEVNQKSSAQLSLIIDVFDACYGKQELTLVASEEVVEYKLMQQEVVIEVSIGRSLLECPIEPELIALCDGEVDCGLIEDDAQVFEIAMIGEDLIILRVFEEQ